MTPEVQHRAAVAMLVGASDGSGLAGVQCALRTCAATGVRAATVITGIRPFASLSSSIVTDQLRATTGAHPVDAIHVGDAGDVEILAALAEHLPDGLVLDPELVDARGRPRHGDDYGDALLARLGGKATLLVVNVVEAERLVRRAVRDLGGAREAAKRLWDHVPSHVLVCGGRLGGHAIDLLYDGRDFVELGADRDHRSSLRAHGATLSATITAYLARGLEKTEAVHAAKRLVSMAIDGAVAVGTRRVTEPMTAAWSALGIDPEPIEVALPGGD